MNGQSISDIAGLLIVGVYQTLFPHSRKFEKYLDTADHDSIMHDLTRVLRTELKCNKAWFSKLFQDFCISDFGSKAVYWDSSSFTTYVRTTHNESVLSDATLRLLWRSFTYYVYHPFPQLRSENSRVAEEAFLRGVMLLALQGNELLGTQEGDWFWREDDGFFRRKSWERMMRSLGSDEDVIGVGSEKNNADVRREDEDLVSDDEVLVSDIMDVLSMTQPHPGLPNCPSVALLEPAARRFLGDLDRRERSGRQVTRRDFRRLMEVLIRVRLGKEKGDSRFHVGKVEVGSMQAAKMANMLVDGCFTSPGREDDALTSADVTRIMDHLPNLHLRFLQLWGTLLQPHSATTSPRTEDTDSSTGVHYSLIGALALLIPQPATSARYSERLRMRDRRIAFEKRDAPTSANNNLSLTRLVPLVSEADVEFYTGTPFVVLFTTSNPVSGPVVGIYLPSSLFQISNPSGETLYNVGPGSTSHAFLFQLWPEIRIANWRGEGVPLVEMISEDIECAGMNRVIELELARIAMGSDKMNRALGEVPYWIGKEGFPGFDAGGDGMRLFVDPGEHRVTLEYGLLSERDAGIERGGEVVLENPLVHVYSVSGGVMREGVVKPDSVWDLWRYTRDENESVVGGEELRARIEGFGSG